MIDIDIGRLAFRQEGEMWNVYWTPDQHGMDKAVLIGSIRMSVVIGHDEVKSSFMATMRQAFDGMVRDISGQTPIWSGERPAAERSHGTL